jgi:uncharacterized membrane protein
VRRFLPWAIALATVAWAALIAATPVLARSSSTQTVRVKTAATTYVVASFVCHQYPERSFHVGGLPLPVCARCSGIYIGAAASVLALGLIPAARRSVPRSARWWRAAIVLAAAPTALTLAVEWLTSVPVSNVARAAAGVTIGAAVCAFVLAAASGEVN